MRRHARWLVAAAAFVLPTGACNSGDTIGLSPIAARSEAAPKKLQDAIAFFTHQFNTVDGGLAVMRLDGSGRRSRAGHAVRFQPSNSPHRRPMAFSAYAGGWV